MVLNIISLLNSKNIFTKNEGVGLIVWSACCFCTKSFRISLMSLALNDEALTLLFVGRLLVAVDDVVVCCVLFGFIDGKGFIA